MLRRIVTMAALSALVVASQAGAATKLQVNGTDGSTPVFQVDDAGMITGKKIGMGTSTPQAPLHLNLNTQAGVTPAVGTALYNSSTGLAVTTQDNSPSADFTTADSTNSLGFRGTLRGVRARGSLAAPAIPAVDDYVFSVLGGVYTGARVSNAADISMKVDGTISEGADGTQGTVSAPVRITFNTRPYGWTWYERLTIKSDGKVGISAPTPTALLDVNSDTVRIRTSKTPASSTAVCNQGDISWDANYVYVCTATNSWKRATLSTF